MKKNDSSMNLALGNFVANPQPRVTPTHHSLPKLEDPRCGTVVLVPFDPHQHARALFRASHTGDLSAKLWTYLPAGPFADPAELASWYELTGMEHDPLFFTVLTKADEAAIGVVSFLAIEPEHASIEIGHIWYEPAWQRTSVNTESCYLLLSQAFDHLEYRRVEWKCDALNTGSRVAALRLGFRFEGIFRQHRIVKSRNRDTAWYSMLDHEWPTVRRAIESWLNWDSNGSRPSLTRLIATAQQS